MKKYQKKFDRYLSHLHTAPFNALNNGSEKAARYHVSTQAGSTAITSVCEGESARMLLIGDRPTEIVLTTVSGESLEKVMANSDCFAIARNTQLARERLIQALCKTEFYHRFDPLFNLCLEVTEVTKDREFFNAVIELREHFWNNKCPTAADMRSYSSSVSVLLKTGNRILKIVKEFKPKRRGRPLKAASK